MRGFPGGSVVKNPPASAGDVGLIPVPGRSHMPWSNYAREPPLLSPCATTTEAPAPGITLITHHYSIPLLPLYYYQLINNVSKIQS